MISCASTAGLAYLFADINATTTSAKQIAALPAPISTLPAASAGPPPSNATPSPTAAVPTTVVPSITVTTPPTTAVSAAPVGFDGQIVGTEYGPVQIQAQIRDGELTEVAVMQSPNAERKSVQINARALPALRTEALAAKSARIDTVSGATYTSDAYRQSLQSALDAAKAAGALAIA